MMITIQYATAKVKCLFFMALFPVRERSIRDCGGGNRRRLFAKQFFPAQIEPERQLQRILRTDGDAGLAKGTFRGKDALVVEDVVADADVHWAEFFAGVAVVALTKSLPDLEEGKARGDLERNGDGTKIFAKCAV